MEALLLSPSYSKVYRGARSEVKQTMVQIATALDTNHLEKSKNVILPPSSRCLHVFLLIPLHWITLAESFHKHVTFSTKLMNFGDDEEEINTDLLID